VCALTFTMCFPLDTSGYDPRYGARPLRRAIQNTLLNMLSIELIDGKIPDGSVIVAQMGSEGVEIKVESSDRKSSLVAQEESKDPI